MDIWIRAKYEKKKWASKTPLPDPSTIVIDVREIIEESQKKKRIIEIIHGNRQIKRCSRPHQLNQFHQNLKLAIGMVILTSQHTLPAMIT